jgi:hypothetical protein
MNTLEFVQINKTPPIYNVFVRGGKLIGNLAPLECGTVCFWPEESIRTNGGAWTPYLLKEILEKLNWLNSNK